jgi:3-hydroxyisobutyrate dehydrogenase-like beta-hydroxyacid dehydrogenase
LLKEFVMSTVGIVGLGEMGSAVARRLLERGHDVVGFDPDSVRTADAVVQGVRVAGSPQEVARLADEYVILLVKTGAHAKAACFGDNGCLQELNGKVLIVMSSLEPRQVQRLAAHVGEHGGRLVDAPSGGGAPAALRGELSLMVSGEAADDLQELLPDLGTVMVVGAQAGTAQAAKMITQLALTVNLVAVQEAIRLAGMYGLDEDTILAAIVASSGTSFVATNWSFLTDFMGQSHIDNISKDLAGLLQGLPIGSDEAPVAEAALSALLARFPVERESIGTTVASA